MKQCPECKQSYYDEALNYCLDDGTRLVHQSRGEESPTAIFTAAVQPGKEQTAIISSVSGPAAVAGGLSPSTDNAIDLQPPATEGSDKLQVRNRWLVILFLILLIPAAGFFAYRYFTPNRQIESIAVMPFVNESGNSDIEYLSDGMTETLISSLSQLPNLNVKARSSVFRYKGKGTDAQTVGKELGVQAILNGRVVQRGQDLILNVELVEAQTENVLWSRNYNRKQTDLVSLQSEIALDVSQKLRAQLSGDDEKRAAKTYTVNSEAYQLYLQGRYHLNRREDRETIKALGYFQQAIDKDPDYALAHIGVADSYLLGGNLSRWENVSKARAAAEKALEIDETLGEAHNTLANIKFWDDWDWASAERGYKRAIELAPQYSTAHHWYGESLAAHGRFDESFAEYQKALEIDPLSLAISTDLGNAYYLARQYDRAEKHLKKLKETNPNYVRTHFYLGKVYEEKGMFEEAIAAYEQGHVLEGRNSEEFAKARAKVISAVKASGARGYWQTVLNLTKEGARKNGKALNCLEAAALHARLAESNEAFVWLEKCYEERNTELNLLRVSPQWDTIRSDAHFQNLLRRVGFPD